MVSELRIVRKIVQQGWLSIDFQDLVFGDEFVLYEATGELVGHFKAESDPYLNDNGVWEIETGCIVHG